MTDRLYGFKNLELEGGGYDVKTDTTEMFSDEFVEEMKLYEGTADYQKEIGYFRDNKFHSYKDPKDHETIGFGHKVKKNESDLFFKGLTTEAADSLLRVDLKDALLTSHRFHQIETEKVEEVLTSLYFQHGAQTMIEDFSEFRDAMNDLDYERAAANLMYVDPEAPEGKRVYSEYFEKYPERATTNIEKLLETRHEVHQTMIEHGIIDTMLDLDESPLEIKQRENYINLINIGF